MVEMALKLISHALERSIKFVAFDPLSITICNCFLQKYLGCELYTKWNLITYLMGYNNESYKQKKRGKRKG